MKHQAKILTLYKNMIVISILAMAAVSCGIQSSSAPTPIATQVVPTESASPTPVIVTETPVTVQPTSVPATAVPTSTPLPSATNVSGEVRIVYAAGATSGSVEGVLEPGQTQIFLVRAEAGQPLEVSTGSLNNDVTFSVTGVTDGKTLLSAAQKLTSWQTMLTVSQDYRITVYAGATTENFTLDVITPARIKFAAGAVSATEKGITPGGRIVSYILYALANQQMDINLTTTNNDALLSVYGFEDGQPYLRSAAGSNTFSMKLPATQDYVVQVVPMAGTEANYTLTITIK